MAGPSLPAGPDLSMEGYGAPFHVLVVGTGAYSTGLLQELAALGGLRIELIRDPREALRWIREEFFDVVIVDLPIQQLSPDELYRAILDANAEQADRVAFLTSDLSDPAMRRFLADAGRPFLTQPFDAAQLYDLVLRVGLAEEAE